MRNWARYRERLFINRQLGKRTQEQWARLLERIADLGLRGKVARIVALDFMWRTNAEQYEHGAVDGWARKGLFGDEPEESAVEAELLKLGYPREDAHRRSRLPLTLQERAERYKAARLRKRRMAELQGAMA